MDVEDIERYLAQRQGELTLLKESRKNKDGYDYVYHMISNRQSEIALLQRFISENAEGDKFVKEENE